MIILLFVITQMVPANAETGSAKNAVCIIDSGICYEHPLFKNKIIKSKDFTGSRHGIKAIHPHGCGTSGVAALHGADNLIIAKSINDKGLGYVSRSVAAIHWCVTSGAAVVNMSFGSLKKSTIRERVINEYAEQGIKFVASAGNRGRTGLCSYPGLLERVINVSSSTGSFSSGQCKAREIRDCFNIKTTSNKRNGRSGGYTRASGTSFCAPQVAAELAQQKEPCKGPTL